MTNNCQPSCLDNDYSACVFPNGSIDWNKVRIYRPNRDVRACPSNPDVEIPSQFSLENTYRWWQFFEYSQEAAGLPRTGDVRLVLPEQNVIYQARTQQVPTNFWSWCVNSGYDPPSHYSTEYKGAMTGAITDTTMCAPMPDTRTSTAERPYNSGCGSLPGELPYFFPSSGIR